MPSVLICILADVDRYPARPSYKKSTSIDLTTKMISIQPFSLDGETLSQKSKKFLGVVFDYHKKFNSHINNFI
jgi:hypothetical protein